MADRIITIAKYNTDIRAQLARQALENNGIRCNLGSAHAATLYHFPAIASIELQVFEDDAQKALEILQEQQLTGEA